LQLDNEDLQQIDADDLEEIDLKWVLRENKNREPVRRNVTVETTDANALALQNRILQMLWWLKIDLGMNGVTRLKMDLQTLHLWPIHLQYTCKHNKGLLNGLRVVRPVENNTRKGNPQLGLLEKGVIDSACSRHMIGNTSYLFEYEEIDGGYVAFEGDPKGDTKCVVLSPDFKLLDESQVLLRVPRKKKIYSVDLKNVAPSVGLTCLFAKATLDESNLWHRRLGHINFKTMNKVVRGNIVKENQEKDKIGSKPDKNGKRGEAKKSQKQLQLKEEEKPKKTKKEWPKTHARIKSY
nr:ribonuclease H-like domain-containing protein [Tanacetum cinerariifolium]